MTCFVVEGTTTDFLVDGEVVFFVVSLFLFNLFDRATDGEGDFTFVGDVVSFSNLDAVSFSSSLFLCFNSVNLLQEVDPTLLGFKPDFEDRAGVDIDLSGVMSESLSFSFSA